MSRKLGFKTIRYGTVTSTNEVLKQFVKEGLDSGTVVTAKVQTDGKGRMARKWESPEGGLCMSVLLELKSTIDNTKFGLVPLMAGSSVATAIIMEYELDASVKWPNDVIIEDRKVCGILCELVEHNDTRYAIIGIGINVNNHVRDGYKFSRSATSISEEFGKNVKLEVLENTVLEELDFRAGLLSAGDYTALLEDWNNLTSTIGKKVRIITQKEENTGIARGIDENGSLILDDNGRTIVISAGDCQHLE